MRYRKLIASTNSSIYNTVGEKCIELTKQTTLYFLLLPFHNCRQISQESIEDDLMIADLKTIIETISEDFEVEIIEQECGDDHLHILFRAKPTLELTKFINFLKVAPVECYERNTIFLKR